MKKYSITVNGKMYEVEVQEAGSSVSAPAQVPVSTPAAAPVASAAPVTATAPAAPAAAPKTAPAAAPSAGTNVMKAPIPGVILDYKVAVGDSVKEGQLIIILEAMKMENEIVSNFTGIVEAIHAAKGDSVNAGDPLISIK